jgi:hypothetical protein
MALLAVFALAALPAAAQSGAGTAALQYYVGSWWCTGGPPGHPTNKATLTYTMDGGILHQTIAVPMQDKMKKAYMSSSSTTYDAKSGRYMTAGVTNDPASFTGVWTLVGNVENQKDVWTSSGKPGRGTTVRNSNSRFTYTGYPSISATKPDFQATCTRNS